MPIVPQHWWDGDKERTLINLIAGILAVGLMTLTAIIVVTILFIPIPAANETLVGQSLGTVLSLLGIVVSFFYGTSTGNRRDRDTINTLAETAKQVADKDKPMADVKVAPGDSVTVEATKK